MNRRQRRLLKNIKILEPGADVGRMVYIANRVADGPAHVPSDTRICKTCRNDVWVDKRSTAHADACDRIVCTHCLVKENRGKKAV